MIDPAGIPRVAATESSSSQNSTACRSVHPDRLDRVGGAGRIEATSWRAHRRGHPIELDQPEQGQGRRRGPANADGPGLSGRAQLIHAASLTASSRDARSSSSLCTGPNWLCAQARRAMTTTSSPARHETRRTASRSRRLARLRWTAPPTRRDAMTATRAGPSSGRAKTCNARSRPPRCRRP